MTAATDLAKAYRCPDCSSENRLVDVGGGVYVLQVMHDNTCPFLRGMES